MMLNSLSILLRLHTASRYGAENTYSCTMKADAVEDAVISDEELMKHCKQFINCDSCSQANPRMLCSHCHLAHYCSRECQRKDWKEHKLACSQIDRIRLGPTGNRTYVPFEEANEDIRKQVLKEDLACAICFECPMVRPVVLNNVIMPIASFVYKIGMLCKSSPGRGLVSL